MNFEKQPSPEKFTSDLTKEMIENREKELLSYDPLEQSNIDFEKKIEPTVSKVNTMIEDLDKELLNYDPSDVLKRKLMDAKFTELQSKIRGLTFDKKVNPHIVEKFKFGQIGSNYLNLLDKKETKEREATNA